MISLDGNVVVGAQGDVQLRHGDEEVRFAQDPFPLYPGEKLSKQGIAPLQVVSADCALRLRALRDVGGHVAGDEWMFNGPGTYTPAVEVQVVEIVNSIIVHENSALKLRARQAFTDRAGAKREAGEEWLWRTTGAFLVIFILQKKKKTDLFFFEYISFNSTFLIVLSSFFLSFFLSFFPLIYLFDYLKLTLA